jgi:type II secretory pathway component PulJ
MEILVALTVTAIVFTALFGVFDRVMNVAGEVDRRAKLSQEARLVMMQIERDLGSIVLNTQNATQSGTNATNATQIMPLQGQSPESDFFDQSEPVLVFSTSSGLDVSATFPNYQIYAVAYWLREQEDGSLKTYDLFRAQRPLVNTVNEQDVRDWEQVLLSSHISSLRVSFFDPQQARILRTWGQDSDTQQTRTAKAPLFVFIQVRFASEDGTTKEFVSLHQVRKLKDELTYFPDLPPNDW